MARFIAFYLPQFHPVPENDVWWGRGFTEWHNVVQAKKLFRGHKQPHLPADLGFYDLRLEETRIAQAELAKSAGIEGFCYWHYWFGNGRRLLERPFNEVVSSGKPDFPFCLGWANESWATTSWSNRASHIKSRILCEQTYSPEDSIAHFKALLPAFRDGRYITVDGKPLFYVYRPLNLPDPKEFTDLWHRLAIENGLKGIHIVAMSFNTSFREIGKQGSGKIKVPALDKAAEYYNYLLNVGFDAINSRGNARAEYIVNGRYITFIKAAISNVLHIEFAKRFDQRRINKNMFVDEDQWENVYPTIMPNWDRSPRSGRKASIYTHSTPQVFKEIVNKSSNLVKDKQPEHQIIFIQSWNEWGEGNYLEPDLEFGHGYINALKSSKK
jgi:hypothetical protein